MFKELLDKPLHARFDQCDSSTDGGAILLKAADERLGLSEALASQPTLSHFENATDVRSLDRMGVGLAECVIARHRKRLKKRVRRITIDLDPTDDPTYGQQQLTFFNTHYANWCYLPMAGFLQFDEEPDQYLFAYVLRPGDAHASYGAIAILRRVIKRFRAAFRSVKIRVRLVCPAPARYRAPFYCRGIQRCCRNAQEKIK